MAVLMAQPKSLLGYLAVGDCNRLIFNKGVWEFPCGLKVSDELVMQINNNPFLSIYALAHLSHHAKGHPDGQWCLIDTIGYDGEGGVKLTANCSCVEPEPV